MVIHYFIFQTLDTLTLDTLRYAKVFLKLELTPDSIDIIIFKL